MIRVNISIQERDCMPFRAPGRGEADRIIQSELPGNSLILGG